MQNAETNSLILSLLRSCLHGVPLPSELDVPAEADWAAVLEELRVQAVHGLAEPILDELQIPDAGLKEAWRLSCIQQQARWHQVASAQEKLLALLEANNIPSVILKGMAAGAYYPKPECRSSGDVDFLVKREQFDAAAKLLTENAYQLKHDLDDAPHHISFEKNGVCFELHRWVGGLRESDTAYHKMFEQGIDHRQFSATGGYTFPVLPPALNGLCLLLHINGHLRKGLGLRQIIDWAMFAEREATDEAWETKLAPILRQMGLEILAVTVTAMAKKYLGLLRETQWADRADPTTCEELMDLTLQEGNFGRKRGKEGNISFFFLYSKNPIRFFRRLQEGGRYRWQAAKDHKFLRPFAWMYQLKTIRQKLKTEKRSLQTLTELHSEGKAQRELLVRLGLDVESTV